MDGSKINNTTKIVLSIITVLLLLAIAAPVIRMLSKSQTKVESFENTLTDMEFSAYDNKLVGGETVKLAIQQSQYPSPRKIAITVETLAGDTTTYGYESESDTTYEGYSESDPSEDDYINPSGRFKATLDKTNGVITGIDFEQQ